MHPEKGTCDLIHVRTPALNRQRNPGLTHCQNTFFLWYYWNEITHGVPKNQVLTLPLHFHPNNRCKGQHAKNKC